ncbi:MAG TPA: DUF6468 domain-containing protein [Stellaceae bacterium]|nr:DUF6468 domain-containing protein [Stellaceae bacterium]
MIMSLVMDGSIAALLVATIIYAGILNHRLAGLRADSTRLRGMIRGLQDASAQAESAVADMKAAAADSGQQLQETIERAVTLKADLGYLNDRASGIADRLETGIRAGRDPRVELDEMTGDKSASSGRRTRTDAESPMRPRDQRAEATTSPRSGARSASRGERPGPGLAFLLQQAAEEADAVPSRPSVATTAEQDAADLPPSRSRTRNPSRSEQELLDALTGRR